MGRAVGLMTICKYCGKDFRSSRERRVYCSDECFESFQTERRRKYGRDNKEAIRKRRTTCKYCNNKFKMKELKERCCSNEKCIEKKKEEKKAIVRKKYYNKNIKRKTKKYKKQDAENSRKYRKNNSEIINKRDRCRKREKREWIDSLKKDEKCNKCGEDRWYCLEYHHVNPEDKKFTIACAISRGYGKQAILEEIKKCVILCSNCHRELHYFEQQEKNEKKSQKQQEEHEKDKNIAIKYIKEERLKNIILPKKLNYKIVEEELEKEWVKDLQIKAQNNLNTFKGNQFTKINNDIQEKIDISKIIANKIGTGKDTVHRSIQIHKRGTEDQKQRVRTGECSINKVYKELEPIRYASRK